MKDGDLLEPAHRIELEIVGDHGGQGFGFGPFQRFEEFDGASFCWSRVIESDAPLRDVGR